MSVLSRVTMAQIAKRAGVSRSAVTAAFSERTTTVGLSPATRAQIHKVATELGYQPNILSRSFIKQRSYLIGMLGRETSFLFALETIKGIEDVLETTDYSLLTFYNGSWADDQGKHLRKSISRRVDGMIIVGAPERNDGPNHVLIKQLQDQGMPIVQIYRYIFPGVRAVMMDDEHVGYLSTCHLIETGHRNIAHLTYKEYEDTELPGKDIEARRRADGYLRAMRHAKLEPAIVTFDRSTFFGLGSNDYTAYCAEPAAQLVHSPRNFTAVTTFNDYAAIGLIHNLNRMGIRVPEDFSVVGCDNAEAGALMRPALTTVRPMLFDVGRRAGTMILEMMDGQAVEDVLITPELIVRGSTVPRSDRAD